MVPPESPDALLVAAKRWDAVLIKAEALAAAQGAAAG